MSPLDDLIPSDNGVADDGLELFSELVTAVAWLRRGAMPALTVWDAIEQALRWRVGSEPQWNEADPLGVVLLEVLIAPVEDSLSTRIHNALRGWIEATASTFNEGVSWLTEHHAGGRVQTAVVVSKVSHVPVGTEAVYQTMAPYPIFAPATPDRLRSLDWALAQADQFSFNINTFEEGREDKEDLAT